MLTLESVRAIVIKAGRAQFALADWRNRSARVEIYQKIEATVTNWAASQPPSLMIQADALRDFLFQAVVEVEAAAETAVDLEDLAKRLDEPSSAKPPPSAEAAEAGAPSVGSASAERSIDPPERLSKSTERPASRTAARLRLDVGGKWLPASVALLAVLVLVQTVTTPLWPLKGGGGCTPTSAKCEFSRVLTPGPGLTPENARSLRLTIHSVRRDSEHVFARIRATNNGSRTIHAVGPEPTRISWRIRTWSQNFGNSKATFDGQRAELGADIAPGETIEIPIYSRLPAERSQLSLVVDVVFVAEARFWSTDVGVPIVEGRLP